MKAISHRNNRVALLREIHKDLNGQLATRLA